MDKKYERAKARHEHLNAETAIAANSEDGAHASETKKRRGDLLSNYLNRIELADELGVKPRTVSEWVKMPNGLPYSKVGRAYLFNRERVLAWIDARNMQRNPVKQRPARARP